MNAKTFEEIIIRFKDIVFSEKFDMIVAIANGGIIPAAILNQILELPIELLKINLRDSNQTMKYEQPKLLKTIDFEFKNKTILLVDDRVKTGQTFRFATNLLQDAKLIKTFSVNGKTDYSLYDEGCFKFPWIV